MNDISVINDWLFLIVPLVVIQLTLQIAAIVSLVRRSSGQIRGNNKLLWAAIIIVGQITGAIVYFIIGRIEGEPGESAGD